MNLNQLTEIFAKQLELAHKFHPIEVLNGYEVPTYPVDVQSRSGQDRCRSFYAYICEEIAEAATAPDESFAEEMSDILHFMVELCLIVGVRPEEVYAHQVLTEQDSVPETFDFSDIIVSLGLAMNTLKAKPWKQSPKPTELPALKYQVSIAVFQHLQLMVQERINPYDAYFAKHNINQDRISSGV